VDQSTSSEVGQEIPFICGTWRFITVFTRTRHQSLSWTSWVQFTPFHPISLKFNLILSSHLCLSLKVVSFLHVSSSETCTHFSPCIWQVSFWSITLEAQLQFQASWCRIYVVDKVALGQVFLQVLWFSTARIMGYAMAQLVEALHYKPAGCRFISWWCHWNFSLTQPFWLHCGPGVDSASNRHEYQEYFLGVSPWGRNPKRSLVLVISCLGRWVPNHRTLVGRNEYAKHSNSHWL